jgi:hypothetical protein
VTDAGVEAVFDPFDAVGPAEAAELLEDLRKAGLTGDVEYLGGRGVVESVAIVALVTVATTTVTGLCVLVTFMQRAFSVGVVVDASKRPVRVRKDRNLPRGTVLMIPRDGEPVLRESISGDSLRELMTVALRGAAAEG